MKSGTVVAGNIGFTSITPGPCHWRDVVDEIEAETTLVELCIDRVDRSHEEERIAIGRRTHDRLGSNIAGGTRPVLDDERLPKPLRQRLTNQPRSCVGRAAAGKADDDAHRPAWVALRPSEARDGGERGSARGQMQELSTVGKFHGIPSLKQRRRDALHSALMLAALIIGHHFSISASWRARSL